ncbi:MAG: DUF692 domain-containing protein [Pseudomonadota bacterium]
MFDQTSTPRDVPLAPGVGFKAQHAEAIRSNSGAVAWLEIHAENYMSDGGPAIALLREMRERFPISCHGVGLSIGGEGRLDREHLARLKKLVEWLDPGLFSEHLAWSTHDTGYFNDLLPLPYTAETVTRVADHIDEVQNTIGRQMLLENPSSYLAFAESTMDEITFLEEVAKRSGCGLLLDVNNVFVSATNLEMDPLSYIDRFPVHLVGELHLGGHEDDEDELGHTLKIDTHSRPVALDVWDLYARVLQRGGAKPTLIEWDNDVPDWPELEAEAARAAAVLERV